MFFLKFFPNFKYKDFHKVISIARLMLCIINSEILTLIFQENNLKFSNIYFVGDFDKEQPHDFHTHPVR